jgi:hypothetical protein
MAGDRGSQSAISSRHRPSAKGSSFVSGGRHRGGFARCDHASVKQALCDASRCPTYVVFKDHSHISQSYSVGTADTSVSGPILRFIHGVE